MCQDLDAERFTQATPKKARDLRQTYPWIYRGFLQSLYAQETGAGRVKNRSI